MPKERIKYIDAIRGVTMLLVIYSHLNYKLFGNYPESVLNNIFVTFRMPLFFFITGFFMYSHKADLLTLKRRFVNRYVKQLYPTFIFLGIFTMLVPLGGVVDALSDSYKYGYWFTFVSVEMFTIFGPMLYIAARHIRSKRRLLLCFCCIAFCSAVLCVIGRRYLSDNIIWTTLSCDPLLHFMPYLLLGFMTKMYYDDITKNLLRKRIVIIAALLFTFTVIKPQYSCFTLVPAVCAIYIIHYLFFKLKDRMNGSLLERVLTLFGTTTLEIYLIHYIVLLGLSNVSALVLFGKSVCNTVWEFPAYFPLCIIVAAICIGIVRLLKILKINRIFFPDANDFYSLIKHVKTCRVGVQKFVSRFK